MSAFSKHPTIEQPSRIPLDVYPTIKSKVEACFGSLFSHMYIPDANRKSFGKIDTGDVDVIVAPHERESWIADIRKKVKSSLHYEIVAEVKNGPQFMVVLKGLWNDSQYMIDFILTTEESFEFKKFFHGHGVILPAVLGSFARSLKYKYDSQGLFGRYKDNKGNYHNILLTRDVDKAQQILCLPTREFGNPDLFTPEGITHWISHSIRFDSDKWNCDTVGEDGQLVVRNRKSHAAAKKKQEVSDTYDLLDQIDLQSTLDNTDYKLERAVLGDKFMDDILAQVKSINKRLDKVLDGREIMELLDVSGPDVGKWVKWLTDRPEITTKEDARRLMLEARHEHLI
jgi:hypothetical protein